MLKRVIFSHQLFLLTFLLLAGCSSIPTDGPTPRAIVANADTYQNPTETNILRYDLVPINAAVASMHASHTYTGFSRKIRTASNPADILAVGDELQMVLWENSDVGLLTSVGSRSTVVDLTVGTAGKLDAPYIGEVNALGRSLSDVRHELITRYETQVLNPDVTLRRGESSARKASILGDVTVSGQMPLPLSGLTLLDMIAMAGAPDAPVWELDVHLTRDSNQETVRLNDIFRNSKNNIAIQQGDIVQVEHNPRTFSVMGAVKTPGATRVVTEEVTIMSLVAAAGGLNAAKANPQAIFVYRDRPQKKPVIYMLDLSRPDSLFLGERFKVLPSDITYVGTASAVTLNRFVNLIVKPLTTLIDTDF